MAGITQAGDEIFATSSGQIALHANGRWFSRRAGTLLRVGKGRPTGGTHAGLGAWRGWQTTWQCAAAGTNISMITTVKSFSNDTFVFEQRFPNGANGTGLGIAPHLSQHCHGAPGECLDQALSRSGMLNTGGP